MRYGDDLADNFRQQLLKACFLVGGVGEAYKTGSPEKLAEAYGDFLLSYIKESGGGINESKLKSAAVKVRLKEFSKALKRPRTKRVKTIPFT